MPASFTDTVRNFVAVLILKITGDAEMVVAARNLTYFVCVCVCVCVCVTQVQLDTLLWER